MNAFDTFWKAYPRKIGKGAARRAYERARRLAGEEDILAGLKRFIAAEPWHGDIQFCPHPTTWLNQERWDDEYETPGALIDQDILERARRADEEEANGQQPRDGYHLRLV